MWIKMEYIAKAHKSAYFHQKMHQTCQTVPLWRWRLSRSARLHRGCLYLWENVLRAEDTASAVLIKAVITNSSPSLLSQEVRRRRPPEVKDKSVRLYSNTCQVDRILKY